MRGGAGERDRRHHRRQVPSIGDTPGRLDIEIGRAPVGPPRGSTVRSLDNGASPMRATTSTIRAARRDRAERRRPT
jgi:hypothetical protein